MSRDLRRALTRLALLSTCVIACAPPPRASRPVRDVELERTALLSRAHAVAATWMRDHPPEALPWSWGEGVLAYGLLRFAHSSGDAEIASYVARYLRAHQGEQVRIAWSDDTTPGLAAAELVLAGDPSVLPVLDRVVHYVMEEAPRTEAQGLIRHLGTRTVRWFAPRAWFPDAWVDSLFHFTITLCRYTRISNEERYRDEAAHQLALYMRNLQDPTIGLVTHAYNDHPRDQQVPSFEERAFWARGNGWALASLVEVWSELAIDHPLRDELGARARTLAAAVSKVQSNSGLFHTLLLDESTYLETAGSGLIVYALARGLDAGLFAAQQAETASRGMRGLLGALDEQPSRAEVSGTSLGTNPNSRRYRRIRQENQVSYGVGAWLLAASATADLRP